MNKGIAEDIKRNEETISALDKTLDAYLKAVFKQHPEDRL